jgi:hypothetical protein
MNRAMTTIRLSAPKPRYPICVQQQEHRLPRLPLQRSTTAQPSCFDKLSMKTWSEPLTLSFLIPSLSRDEG